LLYSVHILLSSLAAKAQNELPGERIDTQITMRCGFQDIMADEEREKLPYFGNNDYLFEVLRKKAGVDVGKNYLKEVERRGYIPFRVDDYSVGDLSSYEQSSNMSLMNALPLTNVVPVTVWIYRR